MLSINRLDDYGKPIFIKCKICGKSFEEKGFKHHIRMAKLRH